MAAGAVRYVLTSLKFKTLDRQGGAESWKVPWKRIPQTHFDRKLRSFRPGWFARHPVDESTVFIYREKVTG